MYQFTFSFVLSFRRRYPEGHVCSCSGDHRPLECLDVCAVLLRGRLEEAAALVAQRAIPALFEVDVLPVRDRPARERPEPAVEHAELMIIDGGVEPSERERLGRLPEFCLVVV